MPLLGNLLPSKLRIKSMLFQIKLKKIEFPDGRKGRINSDLFGFYLRIKRLPSLKSPSN